MRQQKLRAALEATLQETAQAHEQAHADTKDPEWPLWYAQRLKAPLNEKLCQSLTLSQWVHLLVTLDQAQRVEAPKTPWASFYADQLLERFVPETGENLALYQTEWCPYCVLVRDTIDKLGIKIELRDIWTEPKHREDLVAARGRATVPVLRCTSSTGDRWMPESRDIVRYLEQRFG